MAPQKPIEYRYKVSKKFKQVRHYQCLEGLSNTELVTSSIHISKNRYFNNSKDAYYFLKIKEGDFWAKKNTSGLLKTRDPLIYLGDLAINCNGYYKSIHLLVFVFNPGGSELIIYLYKDYYPKTEYDLQQIISNYYSD